LQRAEEIKAMMAKILTARKRGQQKGVTLIEIPVHPKSDPKTCTEWKVLDVPSEMVEHLQRRNRAHFGQAHGTPFTIPPLSTDLGFCGDSQGTEDILCGRYDDPPFPESIRLLIQQLKQVDEVAQNPTYPTISEATLIGKLKVWNKNMTTSPSGLHLGHYKALIARHKYSEDEDDDSEKRDEWNHMQQELLTIHVTLLNYALERGYAYSRGQSIINVILFKDGDIVRIRRTRVIHMYEVDYNLIKRRRCGY
jgi:hypothetical protein